MYAKTFTVRRLQPKMKATLVVVFLALLVKILAASSDVMMKESQSSQESQVSVKNLNRRFLQAVIDIIPSAPETKMDTIQLIESHGYPAERHQVVTSDGYILEIHRIPRGKNTTAASPNRPRRRPVVFLQHGLLSSSSDWVINHPNESLGFILADSGFDVWLGNTRGNTYGRNNTHLDPDKDMAFWAFSFDEHAQYDLPAMLEFVLQATRQRELQLVGHSMGTTMTFAMLASNPKFDQKIKTFHALAPIVRLDHSNSSVLLLDSIAHVILMHLLNPVLHGEFLYGKDWQKLFAQTLASSSIGVRLYFFLNSLTGGGDPEQVDVSRIPVIMSHYPAGTSVQTLDHFVQVHVNKRFAHYDHKSPSANKRKYNAEIPPLYNLSNVSVPVVMYYGENDSLADPDDVNLLVTMLPEQVVKGTVLVGGPSYGHSDFVWGKKTPTDLKVLIDLVKQFAN